MQDPTYDEMETFLKTLTIYEASEFDIACAIYWFSSQWHSGQWSNLYSALSTSPYKPGACETVPSSETVEGMLLEELESHYKV